MAKPRGTDVAYLTLGIRITGWERVGLDLLAERETERLRENLEAAGIPRSRVADLAAPAIVRTWIQREIAGAGLDVVDLKARAEVAYPRAQVTGTAPAAGRPRRRGTRPVAAPPAEGTAPEVASTPRTK